MNKKQQGPKILVLDIETAPILGYVWGLFDQNVALNQIQADWHVLGWAAKWLGESKIMYMDQRNSKKVEDDKEILKGIWKLMDEADIIVSQNGKKFDVKKLNARFIFHGFQPPSSFRQIDTLVLAKKHFGFTSNKLEYMTNKLCTKYKKLTHSKFPGFELWKQCLAGNIKAWKEMERYNKHDILSTEELYDKLKAWDNSINFNAYYEDAVDTKCSCGSTDFAKNGFHHSNIGKYQRYKCKQCGSELRDRNQSNNLLSKDKRKSLKN